MFTKNNIGVRDYHFATALPVDKTQRSSDIEIRLNAPACPDTSGTPRDAGLWGSRLIVQRMRFYIDNQPTGIIS